MRLIWHIYVKDLRRLWLPLTLWAALFGVQYLVSAELKQEVRIWNHDETREMLAAALLVVWALQVIFAWVLIPQLIHDDPLVGDLAAWRTRPISGGRLLAAKLFGLATMLWLAPSLLTLPLWRQIGFSAPEMMRLAAANVLGMAVLTLPGVVIAVLTRDLLRYLGWSLVLLAMITTALLTLWAETSDMALVATRAGLAMGVVVLASIALVLRQFLTRSLPRTIGWLAAAVVLAGIFLWQWPWGAAEALAKTGATRFALPETTARIAHSTLFVPPDVKGAKAVLEVGMDFAVSRTRAKDVVSWRQFDGVLRHGPDGRLPVTMPMEQNYYRQRGEIFSVTDAVQRGRGDEPGPTQVGSFGRIELPVALVPRLRESGAEWSGDLSGALDRARLAAMLPWRDGAWAADGMSVIHSQDVWKGQNGDEQTARMTWIRATPMFTPLEFVMETKGAHRWQGEDVALTDASGKIVGRWQGYPWAEQWFQIGLFHVRFDYRGFENLRSQIASAAAFDAALRDARVADVLFDSVARMHTTLAATRVVPDIVVESSVEAALRRAGVEGKRVLAMGNGSEFEVSAQRQPDAWRDPAVRELLRKNFVVAQVFGANNALFPKPGPWGSPQFFTARLIVLAADGREQDRLRDPGLIEIWQQALVANAAGRTLTAALREELGKTSDPARELIVRGRLASAALIARDYDESLRQCLWFADRAGSRPRNYSNSVSMELTTLAKLHPATRATLLERQAEAVARLKLNPRDEDAARRVEFFTNVLRFVAPEVWQHLPELLPDENPLRWEIVADWVHRSSEGEGWRVPVENLDFEKFFAQGKERLREKLAAAKSLPRTEYQERFAREGSRLVWLGRREVEFLFKAGQVARARRLADEVNKLNRAIRPWREGPLAGYSLDFDIPGP